MSTTLAIETSCDDTSLAIVTQDKGYFSCEHMLTDSQTALHNTYGGVVPEFAYRAHADRILRVLEELWGKDLQDRIDTITVSTRPGLPWALLVWIATAHTLWKLWWKPVIEVNHIMGHVFSTLLWRRIDMKQLPYVCLTVSGGHSDIYLVQSYAFHEKIIIQDEVNWIKRQHLGIWEELKVWPFHVTKIGQTRDDAAWEAFDKVARMLWWPYPGWAWLSNLAKQWKHHELVSFRASSFDDDTLDMSFSGLKSQVYNMLRKLEKNNIELDEQMKANIAFAFEQKITHMLATKLYQAVRQYKACSVGLVGGVAANSVLREQINTMVDPLHISCATPTQMVYFTDNAAMIGVVWLLEHMQ